MPDAISSGGSQPAYEKEEQEEEMETTTGYLPTDTPQAIGSTVSGIKTIVNRELEKDNPPFYILFSNVPPNIIRPSDDSHIPGLKGSRITYNEHIRRLVVKLPSASHEGGERYFTREIELVTNTMGLKRELKLLGSTTVTEQGVSKQPDSSFRPSNLPVGRDTKWPSVVVEIGYSETLNRLHADVQLWISRSRGQVKAVVLISVKQDLKQIIFEKFIPDYTPLRPVRASRGPVVYAVCQQKVVVTRDQGQVVVTGGPLIITFEEMFLRSANPPNEHDYVFGQQELAEIAEDSWDN